MSLIDSLSRAQIFIGLSRDELKQIAALCQQRTYGSGDVILSEGETSRELYIIGKGMVEISLKTATASTPIINLGTGQIFGEMTLVDHGARSATASALTDDTTLHVIPHAALLELCEQDNHIGYIVMRNLAADMSLKLRYSNIAGQMSASEE
jgi:CRP/FNR family cyclic AMP-dependent transcriptional regulator